MSENEMEAKIDALESEKGNLEAIVDELEAENATLQKIASDRNKILYQLWLARYNRARCEHLSLQCDHCKYWVKWEWAEKACLKMVEKYKAML